MKRRARARWDAVLDRIEDRLRDAPPGWHRAGPAADPTRLDDAGLPEEAAGLWARWDGLDLAAGDIRILSLSEQLAATRAADADGRLRPGDRVIAERGRVVFVLPADPYEEGAEVMACDPDADRVPEASSVPHFVLGLLAELSVLYDDDGEFRDELFDEHGGLTAKAERRVARRRLDFDADAPAARLRLAQLLRQGGEATAARVELKRVITCAPTWAEAHHELGRALLDLGQPDPARRAFEQAASCAAALADGAETQAHHLAWAAGCAEGAAADALRQRIGALRPDFATHQARGAAALLAHGDTERATDLIALGLWASPGNLELLRLRRQARGSGDPSAGDPSA